MRARQVGTALLLVVLLTAGTYVLVYLYRWEWTRAQFAFLLFVAAEVALLGVLLVGRLERSAPPAAVDRTVLDDLRSTAPAHRPFAWLSPRNGEMSVFVPILMTAGVLLAALAWLVERVASHTAVPALERSLARRLGNLALPASLLTPDDDPEDLLLPTRVRP